MSEGRFRLSLTVYDSPEPVFTFIKGKLRVPVLSEDSQKTLMYLEKVKAR